MSGFAKYIYNSNTVFKYAKGRSIEDGKEFHGFYEIIYFIDGDAEFISEDISVKMKPRSIILIPKERYHQFIFKESESYQRCTFNFSKTEDTALFLDTCFTKIDIINSTKQTELLFGSLINLLENEKNEKVKATVMSSTLTLLLYILSEAPKNEIKGNRFHYITEQGLEFIENHLKENITLCDVASSLNISVSTLAHTFKADMKISIYKFIQKKRLIAASQLIASGVPTTVAACECGFSDYSGFYRQYKAMFSHSPSNTKNQNV